MRKQYFILDPKGLPMSRLDDDNPNNDEKDNPYSFNSLSQAYRFAHKLNDKGYYVAIAKINIVEQLDSHN